MKNIPSNKRSGFTLVEILVTLMIMVIVMSISAFALREAQKSGRDGRRKADLENIAIGIELYRADCGTYPQASEVNFGESLSVSRTGNCNGTYISAIPKDPQDPARTYIYTPTGSGFMLCANLEQDPQPAITGVCSGCAGGGCDWKTQRP
jgi:prepilin-type N-terminal cleavage/methylation domain-containing protein